MRNLILAIFIFCSYISLFGQTTRFSKTYHYISPDSAVRTEGMSSLIEIPNEGYMFANISLRYTAGNNRSRYVITKVDLNGNVLFAKAYGDSSFQYQPQTITKISDGNYILADSKGNYATNVVTGGLIKINPNGDTLWTKYFSSGLANTSIETAIETSDRGFALAGWTAVNSNAANQLILIKTDSLGNKLWQKTYGGSAKEDTHSIIETPDKGFMIAGWTTSYGNGYTDGYLIKTDSSGNQLWQKIYSTPFPEGIETIIPLIDGNYLLTGSRCLGPGTYDNDQGLLIKINPTGTIIWQKNYGKSMLNEGFLAAKELIDSSIIIAASTWDTVANSWDCWLLKLNSAGDTLWSRVYGYHYYIPNGDTYFFDVVPTQDGGFAFGGFCQGSTHTQDAWLFKTDSLGIGCDSLNCQPNGIDEKIKTEIELTIYPNPANNQLNIEFDASALYSTTNTLLEIRNILGQTIYSQSLKNISGKQSKNIDISLLSKGVYFVRLQCEMESVSKKLIKE